VSIQPLAAIPNKPFFFFYIRSGGETMKLVVSGRHNIVTMEDFLQLAPDCGFIFHADYAAARSVLSGVLLAP